MLNVEKTEMAGEYARSENEESMLVGGKILPFPTTRDVAEPQRESANRGAKTFRDLLCERLGVQEFLSPGLWRASMSELLGTAVLVFMIDTTAISCSVTQTKNTNLVISFLVFPIITILILATAPVSCGHLNPVASFTATLMGLISPTRATVYIVVQCTGATLGAVAVKAVVDDTMEHIFSLGGCTLTGVDARGGGAISYEDSAGITVATALLLEIICTLAFLFGSISIAFDYRQAQAYGTIVISLIVGALMGLLTFVSTTVTAKKGYSGAGMNPAKCFGPALVRGGHLWHGHWVFWVGPGISCLVFYIYIKIIPGEYMFVQEYKYDLLTTLKVLSSSREK